ncbi:MAG: phage portal protein [Clostridiales bacterium]|nr:phage portal protein [Clostridiales bacterium]
MSIFSRIFGSKEPKVQNSTPGAAYRFFYGGTEAGKVVNERTALQQTAVFACIRILAEAIAGLPLHLYRYNEGGSKEKAIDHPLYFLLHDEPNPESSSYIFRETLMTHVLLYGNAYAQIIRNGRGDVTALYPLMSNRMKVDRDSNGKLYYEYQRTTDEAPTMKGNTVILSPHDVLHIPAISYDGILGISPLATAKNAVGLGIAAEEFASKFFEHGATPSGVLEHPSVVKDPERLRESWNAAFGGSSNAQKVAVPEEGLKFSPISSSPENSQLLETRRFQVEEIARIFRIPIHLLGDLSHATFSNIEEQSLEFSEYTLRPWVTRWEQSMTRSLLKPEEKGKYFIKFNMDGLQRGSYESRMRGYQIARQNGWMSANDIRELEQLDKLPGTQGDLYLVNGNMLPLEMARAFYANKDESAAQGDTNTQTEEVGKEEANGQEESNESTDSKEVLELGRKPLR